MDKAVNRRKEGSIYEEMAAEYLESRGHRILERNYRCRMGEIDLISWVNREDTPYWETDTSGVLVFTEVKFRSGTACGSAASAVDIRKQNRIYRVAEYYMMTHQKGEDQLCRFDVIAVDGDQIHHYQNAFGGL